MTKHPPFGPHIYHDTQKLYLEFEGMVLTFPFSEGGLHKALKHVPNIQSAPGYFTGGSNILSKGRKAMRMKKVKLARGPAISDEEAEALDAVLEGLVEDKPR